MKKSFCLRLSRVPVYPGFGLLPASHRQAGFLYSSLRVVTICFFVRSHVGRFACVMLRHQPPQVRKLFRAGFDPLAPPHARDTFYFIAHSPSISTATASNTTPGKMLAIIHHSILVSPSRFSVASVPVIPSKNHVGEFVCLRIMTSRNPHERHHPECRECQHRRHTKPEQETGHHICLRNKNEIIADTTISSGIIISIAPEKSSSCLSIPPHFMPLPTLRDSRRQTDYRAG